MAFYVSYKNSVLPGKTQHSDRVPLSSINGNQKPQRTKEVPPLVSQFPASHEPSEDKVKSSLPFSIFSDNENYQPPIIEEKDIKPALLQSNPFDQFEYDDFKNSDLFPSPIIEVQPEYKIEDETDYLSFSYPYKKENFGHLRGIELKYRHNPNYINLQTEITPNMRAILVDWLVEVGQQFEFSSEAVHLAVNLTDRFLSCTSVTKNKLQLVGIASLFISAKYEEVVAQELKMYAWITDNTYTKKQILRMEQLIMHRLNFYVGGPTSVSFAQLAYSMIRLPKKVLYLAQYLCELSLLDIEPFLSYLPSEIGVAAYCLARYLLEYPIWVDELKHTGYTLENLKPVIDSLFVKIRSATNQSVQNYPSINQKYSHPDFLCVADIQPVEFLIMCD